MPWSMYEAFERLNKMYDDDCDFGVSVTDHIEKIGGETFEPQKCVAWVTCNMRRVHGEGETFHTAIQELVKRFPRNRVR